MLCWSCNPCVSVQCLLDNLLQSTDEQGRGMAETALRDELMTLLVAGQETSAILLGWTTALLARHQGVQQALAAQLHSKLQGRQPTPALLRCAGVNAGCKQGFWPGRQGRLAWAESQVSSRPEVPCCWSLTAASPCLLAL